MRLAEHLTVLPVIVPFLGAPLCVLVDRPRASARIAMVLTWVTLALAVALLHRVLEDGLQSYALGGWAPPWGIEYRVDILGALVILIVAAIGALTTTFAQQSVACEVPPERHTLFYALLLMVLAGLLGIAATGDAFNLFVFLEISSLASYALIAMGRDRRALTAAFQYLVMGTLGATFVLIGVGSLYMMTGTLNMQDLAQRLPAVADTRTVRAGLAFLTVGLGLKLALFPLHLWLPNAYAHAPSVVSALLSATATKVAVYAMLRFMLGVFGPAFSLGEMPLDWLLLVLGAAAVISPSVIAIFQDDLKRMLGYSSVAQVGYMVLGISLASAAGVSAAILHLFNHALMKGALFLAVGAVVYRLGGAGFADIQGLGRRMPWTSAALVIGGLSLIGVPATAGFVSKWYLVLAALEKGWWPLALLVLVGSLLAVVYVWRIVEAAYFGTPPDGAAAVREPPPSMLLPIWALALANLYFGLDTELTAGLATRAGASLIGGAP